MRRASPGGKLHPLPVHRRHAASGAGTRRPGRLRQPPGHIGNRFEKSQQYRRLINEVTEFRNVFWWDNITRHGNANRILEHLHTAHGTTRLFDHVIADLDSFRQQVEEQALEASVRVQAAEEYRSRRFDHAASIAAIAITLPALIFAALALPIQGITSGGHNIPPWLVILLGGGAMLAGATTGAIGGRWISQRAPAKQQDPRHIRDRAASRSVGNASQGDHGGQPPST